MIKLGINVDHVGTLRNSRGESHPDPYLAAKVATKYGANSITIHLREDRRHIKDLDAKNICSIKNLLVNLEISIKDEIVKNALKIKPNYICIVPENRKEITTEGGLNLRKNKNRIKKLLNIFKKNNIRTSLFINPSLNDVLLAKELGSECIEIHTGKFANLVKSKRNINNELLRIKKSCKIANDNGIEVHAGHGLDYKSTRILSKIKEIKEFNIGHFIIGESIFFGIKTVIKKFKKIIR